ncbi:hypothetical protein [Breoghania sp.]|uniref:hypothetical protein n=1 Tax=Breoghania sp. TaxID=2065378 RepID=UPI0026385636|nr:hypothetical protein [Breoghania sp.]MDJ0931319.1 hypothetical protein [Breoghania sp.]
MVELFGSLSAGSGLQENFSFIDPDEMPDIERILRKSGARDADLPDVDARLLIAIALKLVPAKHRLGVVDEPMEAKIVAARKLFQEKVGTAGGKFVLFDREAWVTPLSIEDNLIFGKPPGAGMFRTSHRQDDRGDGSARTDFEGGARLKCRGGRFATDGKPAPEDLPGPRLVETPAGPHHRRHRRRCQCLRYGAA